MMSSFENKVQKKETPISLFLIYTFIVCVVYILPVTKFVLPYLIAAPIMLVTILPFFFKKTPWMTHTIVFCFVFLVLTLISMLAGSFSPVNAINEVLVRNVRFFLPVFWGCYVLKYTTKKQQAIFLIFFAIVVVFMLVNTLTVLETEPWAARILAQSKDKSSDEVNKYRLDNVGGFEFSYMMGIITLCLTWGVLKVKNVWLKVICGVSTAVCFYYIIETMYTTLLLLTFIGAFLILVLGSKNISTKIVLIMAALVIVFSTAPIFDYLSDVFPKESLLSRKFESLYQSLVQEDINQLGDRPQLIIDSLNKWWKAPIFGSYDDTSNSHSMIISMLENGGIVGFSGWVFIFWKSFKTLKSVCEENDIEKGLLIVSFVYVVVLAFLNPIGYVFEVTIAAFFIVPMWSNLLNY